MSVIHIYGASGSGTSTLGRALQDTYAYAHFDSDDYYWLPTNPPFVTPRPRADRVALLQRDVASADNAAVTGSLCGWGDALMASFTLAVRLVVPTEVRVERLKKREAQRFGSRIEAGGDMYEEHIKFLKWASGYDTGDVLTRSIALHDAWDKLLPCKKIVLDGTRPVEQLLKEIMRAL